MFLIVRLQGGHSEMAGNTLKEKELQKPKCLATGRILHRAMTALVFIIVWESGNEVARIVGV